MMIVTIMIPPPPSDLWKSAVIKLERALTLNLPLLVASNSGIRSCTGHTHLCSETIYIYIYMYTCIYILQVYTYIYIYIYIYTHYYLVLFQTTGAKDMCNFMSTKEKSAL